MRWIIGFAALLVVQPVSAQTVPLAKQLEALMDGPDYVSAQWGVLVVDTKTGERIYAREPGKLFTPASVTKLYSCAGLLLAYGADHRFQTPLYLLGSQKDGTATGNLVLVAQGDPMFGSRTGPNGDIQFRNNDHTYIGISGTLQDLTDTDPRTAFRDLAKQVKAAGITRLNGDVLIDDRLFVTTQSTGSGPRTVSPICVNDNIIDIIITPGTKAGDPAQVTLRPDTRFLRTDIAVTTGSEKSPSLVTIVNSDPSQFTIRGSVAVGSKPMVKTTYLDKPADFARAMLIEALQHEGISVRGSLFGTKELLPTDEAYKDLKPVAVHTSAPVRDLLRVVLKVSHNLYATTLPLLVGSKAKLRTEAQGLREQGRLLKKLGVPVERISFGGGAGGANADKVTPEATVELLRLLQKRPDWPDFQQALPVLGVDGTLATAVGEKSPARGKVFAKTGTLYWNDSLNGRTLLTSKALAGIMTAASGRDLTFAIFVNDVPLPAGVLPAREGKLLGQLAELIYLHTPEK